MGVVYKAEDTRLKRFVALKFLSPAMLGGEGMRERFVQEAQAASGLSRFRPVSRTFSALITMTKSPVSTWGV